MAPRVARRVSSTTCHFAASYYSESHAPNIALGHNPHNSTPVTTLTRALALALLLGTVLLAGGAAMHPILSGNGSMELGMIGGMARWRVMHLCMLGGTGLIVIGIWVRLVGAPANSPMNSAVIASLAVITVGIALDSMNTTFMAGPAWRMGTAFAAGNTAMATPFELMHPVGLMAARFGNYLIALGAIVLGAAEWMTAGRPKWLAVLAWIAAAGGLVGVIFFDESTPNARRRLKLLCGWQVGARDRRTQIAGSFEPTPYVAGARSAIFVLSPSEFPARRCSRTRPSRRRRGAPPRRTGTAPASACGSSRTRPPAGS